ncbi:MAG: hypothetical protein ACI8T1_000495 [Verrucomicrobiales bacterium]|jgi:hypothetical protein
MIELICIRFAVIEGLLKATSFLMRKCHGHHELTDVALSEGNRFGKGGRGL